MLVYIVKLTE